MRTTRANRFTPPAKTQVTTHTLPKSFEPTEKAYTKSFFHRKICNLQKVVVHLQTVSNSINNMETKTIKYPVGYQDFKEIRERKMLYVDKTDLIYNLVDTSKYVFLSRPRRFGKSLLTSTLHYYLAGCKELFTGLAIEKLEKNWIQYPVLHFDLGQVKEFTIDDLRLALNDMLDANEATYGITTSGTPGRRLNLLISEIFRKTGRQVVLLVDEYDAPIMDVLYQPNMLLEVRKVMREFYASLKANDSKLKFVFITGVSTFAQMGIFSELNNLEKISSADDYAALCGITEQELKDNFKTGIERLAEKEECTPEEMLARLKDKYDGYHFSNALVDVYNPFSLLNAFKLNDLNDYWFESGTSATLVQAIKQYVGDFQQELDRIENKVWMSQSDFTQPLEDNSTLIPLLYQTGYLTIKEYDKKVKQYLLDYPNAEVRVGLLKNLLPLFSNANPGDTANAASRASMALREGNIDKAMENLQSLLKSIPYGKNEPKILQDKEATEEHYQKFFFLYFRMMCDLVHAEVRNSTGATDVTITTPNYVYVVELKINSTPEVALSQIDEKQYALPYMEGTRAVYKVGVNFSTETRTHSEWKVLEIKKRSIPVQ
jgi:hypothetical protein